MVMHREREAAEHLLHTPVFPHLLQCACVLLQSHRRVDNGGPAEPVNFEVRI